MSHIVLHLQLVFNNKLTGEKIERKGVVTRKKKKMSKEYLYKYRVIL